MGSFAEPRGDSPTADLTNYSPEHLGGEWTSIVLDPPNGDQTHRFCLGPTETSMRLCLDALLDQHPVRTSHEDRQVILTKLMNQLNCLRARGERIILSDTAPSEDG